MDATRDTQSSFKTNNQSQVYAFWESLSQQDKEALEAQLAQIDPQRVNAIYKQATEAEARAQEEASSAASIEPPPAAQVESTIDLAADDPKLWSWFETGMQAVKDNQVAVLLLAGGQGTRLGSSAPKGCYDIGLPSHKSLFQLQAERIAAMQVLATSQGIAGTGEGSASARIPWYIMTSGPTRKPTEAFFEEHNFFGLDKRNVVFFEQGGLLRSLKLKRSYTRLTRSLPGVLPCLDNEGKILLDTPSSCAVAPDGNGGLYAALLQPSSPGKKSVLEDARSRGIKYLHAYGVDNCLVRVADPVFMGYCIGKQADCGVKVVRKTDPAESVGVVARKNGKWGVLEYSEIPKNLSEAKDPANEGQLLFRAANIANHFFSLDFLDSVKDHESDMPYHIARKKIPHVDLQTKELVKPSKPNGVKMELFIFDVFPFAKNMAVFEVDRKDFFSPLKNAPGTGTDDPQTFVVSCGTFE